MSDTNEEVVVDTQNNDNGEVIAENHTPEVETITVPKTDYDKLNETVGSLKREVKDLKKTTTPAKEPAQQSNEPDYGRIAYLNSAQVSHPDDQKLVLDEANRLKLPLTDVLQMEHIQSKLKVTKATRDSQAGMPNGSGRVAGATRSDVEYYLENPNEHPEDPQLAYKVIDAKMKRETDSNKFSKELYTG